MRRIVDPGIYFFAVAAFSGTGPFIITPFVSTHVANGLNHTQATAAVMPTNNFTTNGVLCNPYDWHWFRFDLSGIRLATFTFNRAGMSAEFFLVRGQNVYVVNPGVQYTLFGGRYYIIVRGINRWHNPTLQYTLGLSSQDPPPPRINGVQNAFFGGTAFGGNFGNGISIFRNSGLSLTVRGRAVCVNGGSVSNADIVVVAFNPNAPGGDTRRQGWGRTDNQGHFTVSFTPNVQTSSHEGNWGQIYIRRSIDTTNDRRTITQAFFAWRH